MRGANGSPLDVESGFEEAPDSVISEYGLASYLPLHLSSTHTHSHTQAICHPDWTPTQRGLHLSALFVPVSQPADKSSPDDPRLNLPPITIGPALS